MARECVRVNDRASGKCVRGYSRIASHFRDEHYNEVGVNVIGLIWKGLEHCDEARICTWRYIVTKINCGFPIAQTEMLN